MDRHLGIYTCSTTEKEEDNLAKRCFGIAYYVLPAAVVYVAISNTRNILRPGQHRPVQPVKHFR